MKKLLLSTICIFGFYGLSHAQVVDVVGKGVHGIANSNLTIPEPDNVEKLDVGAFFKGGVGDPGPNDVLFEVYNDGPSSMWMDDVIRKPASLTSNVGYFTQTFESVDHTGVNFTSLQVGNVHSFYSYIYRNDLTSEAKSYVDLAPTFHYHNGAADPYVYKIPIHEAETPRQIRVKVPVSELDAGPRMVVIKIDAGPVSFETQENTWNYGDSFFLGSYTMNNVPGNVKTISVSIYSPSNSHGEENGDSFFVSGVVVDVEKTGCTYTQGYWKNHSYCKQNGNGPQRDDTWDQIGEGSSPETNTLFFKSDQTYCEVFDTKPNNQNGKYYILAHQYIAAELNLLNNADPTDIAETFNKAKDFLGKYSPIQVKGNKQLEAMAISLGGKLDEFNSGKTGRGHCGDDQALSDGYTEKIQVKELYQKSRVKIYPNPVVENGIISFKAHQSGPTTVGIYNISGQKVDELNFGKSTKDSDVNIEFNTMHLNKGLYFVEIKNGSDVYRSKISVTH